MAWKLDDYFYHALYIGRCTGIFNLT